MSEVKVNKISPRTNCGTTQLGDAGDTITVTGDLKSNSLKTASGSTLTLGQSGDTVTLASGASQSGFGRTGTVDWDTTAKTAAFTAVSGNGYFVNTTSGAITVTLPASPSAGDIVSIADYANTADTNNITIARNGSPIEGGTNNHIISAEGGTATLVYVDGTQGWRPVHSANSADFPAEALFTAATGGTVTTCGDFKIHTFTGPGTLCISSVGNSPANPAGGPNALEYLVVAGGGAGRFDGQSARGGGGGGGGGYRTSAFGPSPLQGSTLTASAGCFPITVGAGGTSPANTNATRGGSSIFSTITSTGGGGGGFFPTPHTGQLPSPGSGAPGGSGGGGGDSGGTSTPYPGGAGNTPPVDPPQGNPGGAAGNNPNNNGGGGAAGGGAGATGSNNFAPGGYPAPGVGGAAGVPNNITGSDVTYSAGGSGGPSSRQSMTNGPDNSGNGGSGGSGGAQPNGQSDGQGSGAGGSGGSGIVVVRYKFQ